VHAGTGTVGRASYGAIAVVVSMVDPGPPDTGVATQRSSEARRASVSHVGRKLLAASVVSGDSRGVGAVEVAAWSGLGTVAVIGPQFLIRVIGWPSLGNGRE
jgi:hypothetical protein